MIVTGGGTGGHVFPGVAVAEKFMNLRNENKILYVGAKGGMEESLVLKYGFDLELLKLGGIKGKGVVKKTVNLVKVTCAVFSSMRIIKRFKPDVVFGVGGYASYPTIFAARLLGIKSAILEQNTVAGLANRVLGKLVNRIYTVFEYTEKFFPKKKVLLTGNPIRQEIADVGKKTKKRDDVFCVLILGGSQGASNINKKTIESLSSLENLKGKIKFLHQTGKRDFDFVKTSYDEKGFDAEVTPFIGDMAEAFEESDLVISRSGSGICEIAAAGKASLLVPYPYSSYDHQEINADIMVNKGAAEKVSDKDLSGERIASFINKMFSNDSTLKEMSFKALSLSKPLAAEKITKDLLALAGGNINA